MSIRGKVSSMYSLLFESHLNRFLDKSDTYRPVHVANLLATLDLVLLYHLKDFVLKGFISPGVSLT